MQDNIAISVKNLTKVYHLYDNPKDRLKEALNPFKKSYHHDFYALNDVSFEIKKGETVGIIGKNGAGKSTLLKIITGVLTPTSGEVEVNGKIASLLELGAGFNPEMTGIENIYLNGTIMGFTKEEMDAKVDAILSFADIGEFINQPVKMYSSGMFARLAFSLAINVEPDVLIVDEALSVGDARFQNKCIRKMEKFTLNNKKTILFVTHDMQTVNTFCDKAIWINNGEIVNQGKTIYITKRYLSYILHGFEVDHANKNKSGIKNEDYNDHTIKSNRVLEKIKYPMSFQESFGSKAAIIKNAWIEINTTDEEILTFQGGENISVKILVESNTEIKKPLIGLLGKNELVSIFSINNDMYEISFDKISNGKIIMFSISFIMPLLRNGKYSLDIAISDGDQNDHKQLHYIYDAIVFDIINPEKEFSISPLLILKNNEITVELEEL